MPPWERIQPAGAPGPRTEIDRRAERSIAPPAARAAPASSSQVLTRQLDALRAEVPDLSLYTLLAAPLRAKRATQPDSNGAAAPFFEWWQCPANQPPSAVAPMANSAAAAEQLMLEGLEASARAVVECVIRHGPFDAVLGFSQADPRDASRDCRRRGRVRITSPARG